MTSYSRIFYEVYDPLTGRALAPPTDYTTARTYADEAGAEVRFVAAKRFGKDCPPEGPVPARHDGEGEARISGGLAPDFFDDEISRAIRTTEIVPAVNADRHGNQIAHEGADRCFCGCKYWEHDRCIDCGTHVTTVREFPA